jgi:hypothetical protein
MQEKQENCNDCTYIERLGKRKELIKVKKCKKCHKTNTDILKPYKEAVLAYNSAYRVATKASQTLKEAYEALPKQTKNNINQSRRKALEKPTFINGKTSTL